jgi:hypothetical protein
MKIYFTVLLSLVFIKCSFGQHGSSKSSSSSFEQKGIKNKKVRNYIFLKDMYADEYFPVFLVDKGKAILINLCVQIEKEHPKSLLELYNLTHVATIKFNDLENEFENSGSELETGARETIAGDFIYIAKAYGFEADTEELIAPRNW